MSRPHAPNVRQQHPRAPGGAPTHDRGTTTVIFSLLRVGAQAAEQAIRAHLGHDLHALRHLQARPGEVRFFVEIASSAWPKLLDGAMLGSFVVIETAKRSRKG